jgi:hypothetical protein
VARTLAEIAKVQGERDPQADRARVREIDAKLVNLARLAAETAEVAEVAKLISTLNAERTQLRARIETAPQLPDADRLRRKVLEHALRLREAFDGDPESGKATLRALLGDRRMTVAADPEHGFRVEGIFSVPSWPSGPQGYRGAATSETSRSKGARPYLGCMKNAVDFSGRTWVGMRSFSGTTCRSLRPRAATGPATATRYTATARKA